MFVTALSAAKCFFTSAKQWPFKILLVKNLSGIRLEDAKYIAKNIPISKVTSIHPTIPSNSIPHMLQQKRTTIAKDNSITIRKYLSIKRPKKSEIRTNKGKWTFLNEELHQNNKNIQLVECWMNFWYSARESERGLLSEITRSKRF